MEEMKRGKRDNTVIRRLVREEKEREKKKMGNRGRKMKGKEGVRKGSLYL